MLVILLTVYRSVLLPLVVIVSAVLGLAVASAAIYFLARAGLISVNGQAQGISSILAIGAATDYALLLIARFREQLAGGTDRYTAMRVALRRSAPPIVASGLTVALGLLCLLFGDLNSNRALGPAGALAIGGAVLASLTFLPAVLALLGRAAFWPARPVHRTEQRGRRGLWDRVAAVVGRRPRAVWLATGALLVGCAAFLPTLRASGIALADTFVKPTESVTGQAALARHFPAGDGSPAVIIASIASAPDVRDVAASVPGVADARVVTASGRRGGTPQVVDGLAQVEATLSDVADSDPALRTVDSLRAAVHAVPGADALVGGTSAVTLDTRRTAERDLRVILPLVLVVILLVLIVLLRAVVAPLLLIATVVLSFAATLGVAAVMFNYVFDFAGADPSTPLYGFVFLVALGVDYNIFLMTRVREESTRVGTRSGVLRGLVVTGGVITSAGVVLAATFGALLVIPVLALAEIAFIVAFGVLLDALVVRSLLVPALVHDLGDGVWWPSRLARGTARLPPSDRASESGTGLAAERLKPEQAAP